MDREILKEVGLTSNEIEVYLVLLRSKSASANDLAAKAGLHRQVVYDALDRLLEKGFASFAIMNNKKYFQGTNPEKILDYLKEKQLRFSTILPELLEFAKAKKQETSVEVYKGKSIVRVVYSDVRNEVEKKPGEILISGVDERKFEDEDKIALEQHLKKLHKMKCKERILVKEGDTHFMKGPQSVYKWISREFFSPIPVYVYGNKLTTIIWGKPNHAIIIENSDIADAYRKQFNLLWKIAKEVK